MPLTQLQRVIFHSQDSLGAAGSYLHKRGGYQDEASGGFHFFRGLEFDTLTFYNAFPASRWRDYTGLDAARLKLSGTGAVLLEVLSAGLDGVRRGGSDDPEGVQGQRALHRVLIDKCVDLADHPELAIDLEDPRIEHGDLLYFRVTPLEDGVLQAASYATEASPRNPVRLGIVLTHFNRQQAVQAAASRIDQELLQDPEFAGHCALTIVDNSSNAGVDEGDSIAVIPNANYGGAGGFARGLLELEREGGFTHCVFMDDDASCEIESLRRIYRLMAYSTSDSLAVAGILLRGDSPNRLYERGAIFDGMCSRLHADLDMSQPEELLLSEQETRRANYGGWWLFGFRIADVKHYPFPFFVRGDDVAFCLMNRFKLVTLNGIASYGDSFESKNGPLTTYLDTRSHLVHQVAILDLHWIKVFHVLWRFFTKALLSHEYGRAEAVMLAMADFSQGAGFFANNMDMSSRFPVLRDITSRSQQTLEQADRQHLVAPDTRKEHPLRKIIRLATLNGLLLPGFMLRDQTVLQPRGFRARFRDIFRFRRVCYASAHADEGYVVELDRYRIVVLGMAFLRDNLKFALNYRRTRAAYARELPRIAGRDFWATTYPEQASSDRAPHG